MDHLFYFNVTTVPIKPYLLLGQSWSQRVHFYELPQKLLDPFLKRMLHFSCIATQIVDNAHKKICMTRDCGVMDIQCAGDDWHSVPTEIVICT